MKEIICKNGEVCKCDDEDFPLLSRFTWYMIGCADDDKKYPSCYMHGKGKFKKWIPMHQMVMAGTLNVDHEDRNKFNNQKINLREATYQQNGWNAGKAATAHGRPCTSKYKGVQYAPLRGIPRWIAQFKYVAPGAHKSTGKMIRLGYFWNEDDAARAYNKRVKELRGEWAWLNPVPEIAA